MKNRLAKVGSYVKDHAPELITATAAVVLTAFVIKTISHEHEQRWIMQRAISAMREDGRPFTYYPGIGVYWDNQE